MSLPVTFHRAANAEFSAASTWYESKRRGLALEFITALLRLTVVYHSHLNIHSGLRLFAMTFGASSPIVFHTAFIFVRSNIVLLSWRYFMVAEIPQFGWREPNLAVKREPQKRGPLNLTTRASPSLQLTLLFFVFRFYLVRDHVWRFQF